MGSLDISKMTVEELHELSSKVAARTAKLIDRQRKELADKWQREAAELGLTPREVIGGGRQPGRKRAPAKPKYRNPEDPTVTWSGRGKQPNWLKEALGEGKALEELRIPS